MSQYAIRSRYPRKGSWFQGHRRDETLHQLRGELNSYYVPSIQFYSPIRVRCQEGATLVTILIIGASSYTTTIMIKANGRIRSNGKFGFVHSYSTRQAQFTFYDGVYLRDLSSVSVSFPRTSRPDTHYQTGDSVHNASPDGSAVHHHISSNFALYT